MCVQIVSWLKHFPTDAGLVASLESLQTSILGAAGLGSFVKTLSSEQDKKKQKKRKRKRKKDDDDSGSSAQESGDELMFLADEDYEDTWRTCLADIKESLLDSERQLTKLIPEHRTEPQWKKQVKAAEDAGELASFVLALELRAFNSLAGTRKDLWVSERSRLAWSNYTLGTESLPRVAVSIYLFEAVVERFVERMSAMKASRGGARKKQKAKR